MIAPELTPTIRYAVREVKLFVAHCFDAADEPVVNKFKAWLDKIGFNVVTGEAGASTGISDKVRNRIDECEVFAGIFTRRGVDNGGKWKASEWLIEEKTYALAQGKPLMLFVENGVEIGGMHADHEYIPFSREDVSGALLKAFDYVLEFSGLKLTISSTGPNSININFAGDYLKPEMQLKRVDELLKRAPESHQLRIRRCDLLLACNKRKEAKREFETLVQDSPRWYTPIAKLAQLYEEDSQFDEANSLHERMLILEPSKCQSYCSYGRCLVAQGRQKPMNSKERNQTLNEAKNHLETAIGLAGQQKCPGIERARRHLALACQGEGAAAAALKFKQRNRISR